MERGPVGLSMKQVSGFLLLLAVFGLQPREVPPLALYRLSDKSLVEGRLLRTRQGQKLVTPFGFRLLGEQESARRARTTLRVLTARYREMLRGVSKGDRAQNQAVALWCLKHGYLTGLRGQLNRLLAQDIDDAWALKRIAALARLYKVDESELGSRPRDARRLVDFLFEKLARQDHVGAVLAVEKARTLPRKLSFRPAIKAVRKGSPRMRWAGARVLAWQRHEPTRIPLLFKKSLQDGWWAVRREAVRALKETGDPVFVHLYVKHLRGPRHALRLRAAQALAELGMSEATKPLIDALGDTWRPVHNYVAVTNQLAYVKDFDVEVAQTAFIADPVVDVLQEGEVLDAGLVFIERRVFRDALRRITGQALGTRPRPWRAWLASQGGRHRH